MGPHEQRIIGEVRIELEAIVERLSDLTDWAVDGGYRAVEHKLQEASGPLNAVAEACTQYADGRLTPRR